MGAAVEVFTELAAICTPACRYFVANKLALVNCTVGTTYHIAPINKATFVARFISGGESGQYCCDATGTIFRCYFCVTTISDTAFVMVLYRYR